MSTIIPQRQTSHGRNVEAQRARGANWRTMREAVGVTRRQAAYWTRMPLLRLESIEAGLPMTESETHALGAVILNAANRRLERDELTA